MDGAAVADRLGQRDEHRPVVGVAPRSAVFCPPLDEEVGVPWTGALQQRPEGVADHCPEQGTTNAISQEQRSGHARHQASAVPPASLGSNRSHRRIASGCSLSDWHREPAPCRHSGVASTQNGGRVSAHHRCYHLPRARCLSAPRRFFQQYCQLETSPLARATHLAWSTPGGREATAGPSSCDTGCCGEAQQNGSRLKAQMTRFAYPSILASASAFRGSGRTTKSRSALANATKSSSTVSLFGLENVRVR